MQSAIYQSKILPLVFLARARQRRAGERVPSHSRGVSAAHPAVVGLFIYNPASGPRGGEEGAAGTYGCAPLNAALAIG